jgi:hypothetical protein
VVCKGGIFRDRGRLASNNKLKEIAQMKKFLLSITALAAVATTVALAAAAATTVVVTPSAQQGWTAAPPDADTRPGGAVNFVADATAPAGAGALQLTTDATTAAKAQYVHAAPANTLLSSVTEASYSTKQNSSPFAGADASYQLPVFLNGGTSGFTTLVFEPYQNPAQGAVVPGAWQKWNVAGGLFWSTRTVTCSNGTVVGTPGGPAAYTLSQINALCPGAVVIGYLLNVGTNNPSWDVEADLFDFNGTTYDFEPAVGPPTNKDQCKNGGWQTFNTPKFKNQGDCVSFVATGGKNGGNG